MNFKRTCLLLGLCQAGSAAALGMGDISVRSHLGQPLDATVTLLEAPAGTTADCFSLTASTDSIAPPLRATLSIERTDGRARLHIRTASPVNDPIAQFVLISDCEVRLQREYAILLDPPAAATPALDEDAPAVEQIGPAPVAVPVPPVSHSRRHRGPASAARATHAASPQRTTPHARPASENSAPRLVLSGKHDVSRLSETPVALRLDTGLPDLTRPRPQGLTATELSDENAALARRLAHLEAQLAALQRRNDELEAARHAAAVANAAPPVPPRSAQWPLYLLAMGVLAGLTALAAWLLRRNRTPRPMLGADTLWPQTETQEKTLSELSSGVPAEPPSPAQRMSEIAAPPLASDTEVKEDILDQAEVFMAHGHGELAIHLLQEHLREAPNESPVPWLLLLDLLHREGDTAGYAAASAGCRRYFNVNLTDHPVSQDNENGLGVEAYPHVLEQLVTVWNTPAIEAFFNDLIYDNRGGTRIGFEPGAYRDILLLRTIAQETLSPAA